MENTADFNDLAMKFSAARGEETYCNLFGAAFALEKWIFTARGELPNITIDSNELRHVQTGATLSMSFALLKFPGGATDAFYFGMQGSRSEVERLLRRLRLRSKPRNSSPRNPK